MEHLKQQLGPNLHAFVKGKVQDGLQQLGRRYPCTVNKVISSGIVEVNFEVNAGNIILPKITMPVAYPEYIRYPIQVGDKGFCSAADARIGAMSGLGAGVPDLTLPGNLSALMFYWLGNTHWTDPVDPDALELYGVGDKGVILHDGNSTVFITLTSDGVVLDMNGMDVTINGAGGDVIVNGGGNVTINDSGDVQVNGGDVIADTISLKTHTHGGVTTGSGDTGEPIP